VDMTDIDIEYSDNRCNSDGCSIKIMLPYDTVIGSNVKISNNVSIGHNVVIGDNVVIKEGAKIGNDVILSNNVVIGRNSCIKNKVIMNPYTVTRQYVKIGKESRIGDPNYFKDKDTPPNERNVIIRKWCDIGNNVTIGEDVIIEKHSTIRSNVIISGYTHIGKCSSEEKDAGFVYIGGWSIINSGSDIEASAGIGYCSNYAGYNIIEPDICLDIIRSLKKSNIFKKMLYNVLFNISCLRYKLFGR